MQFEFECIDYWSRAVFKAVHSDTRIGCLDVLFPNKYTGNTTEEIVNYFKANKDKLCYFGTEVDCDPVGTVISPNKFEII